MFVPPEDNPKTGSKPVVGNKETLLIVGRCGDGILKIVHIKHNRKLKSKNKTSLCYTDHLYIY